MQRNTENNLDAQFKTTSNRITKHTQETQPNGLTDNTIPKMYKKKWGKKETNDAYLKSIYDSSLKECIYKIV